MEGLMHFMDHPVKKRLERLGTVLSRALIVDQDKNAPEGSNNPYLVQDCLITIGEVLGQPGSQPARGFEEIDLERARAAVDSNREAMARYDEQRLVYFHQDLFNSEEMASYEDGSAAMAEEAHYREQRELLEAGALHFGIDLLTRLRKARGWIK